MELQTGTLRQGIRWPSGVKRFPEVAPRPECDRRIWELEDALAEAGRLVAEDPPKIRSWQDVEYVVYPADIYGEKLGANQSRIVVLCEPAPEAPREPRFEFGVLGLASGRYICIARRRTRGFASPQKKLRTPSHPVWSDLDVILYVHRRALQLGGFLMCDMVGKRQGKRTDLSPREAALMAARARIVAELHLLHGVTLAAISQVFGFKDRARAHQLVGEGKPHLADGREGASGGLAPDAPTEA